MPPCRPWPDPVGRTLRDRLDDLCADLDLLGRRLHEGVTQAVSQAVAGAVRDAELAMLADP